MNNSDLYSDAHLCVAAVRILTYQKNIAPSIAAVCKMLSISNERGHQLFRKLEKNDIVTIVDSGFSAKVFVKNHLAIEDIDRNTVGSKFDEALKSFQTEKEDHAKIIEALHSKHKQQKQKLFADLEKKLKAAGNKPS
jgi:hypothetical protein